MRKLALIITAVLLLSSTVKAADVKIGANKELIVDGKQMFLLGSYGPMRTFAYFKKLGLNCVPASDGFFAKGVTNEMCFAEAKRLGLYTNCSISDIEKVNKNDPTLIMWDQTDEPDYIERDKPGSIKELIDLYKKAHTLDNKPVNVCFGSMFAGGAGVMKNALYVEYAEKTADVVMTDIYPVGNIDKPDNLYLMGKAMKNLEKITKGKKPLMIAVEVCKINDKAARAANAYEVRAEIWMVIIHGAKGIFYFPSRFDHVRFSPVAIPEDVEAELIRTNGEVTALTDVILSGDSEAKVDVVESETATAATMLKEKGDKYYLFTINMKKAPGKLKFTVAGANGSEAEVYGEGRKVKVVNGSIEEDFKGYEPHIYVMSKK